MNQEYYQRKLPHWQPLGYTYFITYRLFGSMPKTLIKQLQAINLQEINAIRQKFSDKTLLHKEIKQLQNRYFVQYDKALDLNPNEPQWLKIQAVAEVVYDSLMHMAKNTIHLHAFCIMPNHVHLVLTHNQSIKPLFRLLQSHKTFTARRCNEILKKSGSTFWEEESYDHLVRNEAEFFKIIRYTLNNPVKAGLVGDSEAWPWNYCEPDLYSFFYE